MSRLIQNYIFLIYFVFISFLQAKPIKTIRKQAFNTTFVRTQDENKTDLHLRLWLNDLISATFGKSTEHVEADEVQVTTDAYNKKLPIFIEETNAGQLEIQLEYLQSHGNDIQSKLKAEEPEQKNTIYLNQETAHTISMAHENNTKPTKATGIEEVVNEYTGDVSSIAATTTEASSNVYKLINFPLVTTKIHIPTIVDKSNEQKTTYSSWVNDKLASKQHDQQAAVTAAAANTLTLTKPQAVTLTATTTDGHLVQGNNINKQQQQQQYFEFADQVNIFSTNSQQGLGLLNMSADTEHAAETTTAKNLILIEKTLTAAKLNKVSNSNLNVTNENDHNKPQLASMGEFALAGNYMLANPGKYKNSKTNLTEIQQNPAQSFVPDSHMQNEHNEFIVISTRPAARILHEDIGITINCVTFFAQPDDDKRIVESIKVQNGNEFNKIFDKLYAASIDS